MENRITEVLKNLRHKREISDGQYTYLSPLGLRPGIVCGLAKFRKFSQVAFHLSNPFCLPLVHHHRTYKHTTYIPTYKVFSSNARNPNNE